MQPVFLHRNLAYMKYRRRNWRKTKRQPRSEYKVDSILDKVMLKSNRLKVDDQNNTNQLKLAFVGLFNGIAHGNNGQKFITARSARIEIYLIKIFHRERKDTSTPIVKQRLTKMTIPCNPKPLSTEFGMLTIPCNDFLQNNGHSLKNCTLRVQATVSTDKNLRVSGKMTKDSTESSNGRYYIAEVIIFDDKKRCHLLDGIYELSLRETKNHSTDDGNTFSEDFSWEGVKDSKGCGPILAFEETPKLKLRVTWDGDNDPNFYYPIRDNMDWRKFGKSMPQQKNPTSPDGKRQLAKREKVYFQFVYSNYKKQQTESRNDYYCPWCQVDCVILYCLLKHLRLCHARFSFIYMRLKKGALIDVSINENYHLATNNGIGYAFYRNGPTYQLSASEVITYKPCNPLPDLTEFLEPDESYINTFGRNLDRSYYHSHSGQCMHERELDEDSEDELYPNWHRHKSESMIDEFTDVNQGEKELMKLWNGHIMSNNRYIADGQVANACETFAQEYATVMIKKGLQRNFLQHLVNLYDYTLISASCIEMSMATLTKWNDSTASSNGTSCE
ncbi:Polycomb protein suz12 [Trichoplax sp. H2]|nr:Polycomb protein suz12 [Trichoplax sp. H2]|eukprot:RDD43993.1 Polycomb protein suz12 [Trichoplax sp. H2]